MKISAACDFITQRLKQANIEQHEARMIARLLLSHHLKVSLSSLPLLRGNINPEDLLPTLTRLENGEPLQYVIGETEFMGLPFRCEPGVLIPRLDSEPLAERAIMLLRGTESQHIADVCCGSGTYGLTLAHYLPKAEVVLSDISPAAVELATQNAAELDLLNRVTILHGDLLIPLINQGCRVNLLICNPPYIPRDELAALPPQVRHEPMLALDGGLDGLDFYRRLAREAAPMLCDNGWLLLEHGDDQQDAIAHLLTDAHFIIRERLHDLAGRPRGLLVQQAV